MVEGDDGKALGPVVRRVCRRAAHDDTQLLPCDNTGMSHRNDLNELTLRAADAEIWQDAAATLHEAFQIVGIVLDDLEERVKAIEARADLQR